MLAVGIREWQTGRLILSDGRRAVSFVIVFVAQCRREREGRLVEFLMDAIKRMESGS